MSDTKKTEPKKENKEASELVEVFIVGLVMDPNSNAPIVVLKDAQGEACLPIWVGQNEATAIASALKQIQQPRPMTHDLLKSIVDTLGGTISSICISGLKESTFFASVEIATPDSAITIDARPSDAIALAVRCACPIFVNQKVLNEAQVTLVPMAEGEIDFDMPETLIGSDVDFQQIDKDKWQDILEEMEPDDFKYKM